MVTLSVLVPLLLSAAWSATVTRREREAEVRDQATSIAATAGAYLNQYLRGLDSMASALVRHQSVIALDGPACDRLFAEVLGSQPLVLWKNRQMAANRRREKHWRCCRPACRDSGWRCHRLAPRPGRA